MTLFVVNSSYKLKGGAVFEENVARIAEQLHNKASFDSICGMVKSMEED